MLHFEKDPVTSQGHSIVLPHLLHVPNGATVVVVVVICTTAVVAWEKAEEEEPPRRFSIK